MPGDWDAVTSQRRPAERSGTRRVQIRFIDGRIHLSAADLILLLAIEEVMIATVYGKGINP